jgi:hypothetical protein
VLTIIVGLLAFNVFARLKSPVAADPAEAIESPH